MEHMVNKLKKYHHIDIDCEQQGIVLRDISIAIDKTFMTAHNMEWLYIDFINDFIEIYCIRHTHKNWVNNSGEYYAFSVLLYEDKCYTN